MQDPTAQDMRERLREALSPLHERREQLWSQAARGEFPELIWTALAQANVFRSLLPDGEPRGLLFASMALRELGAAGHLVLFPALTIAGSYCLVRHGDPALHRSILGDIAAGRCRLCFGITEARTGFNILETASVARAEGDHYVLTGEKSYVSGFPDAQEMLVIARTRPLEEATRAGLSRAAGLSLFLVPTQAGGVQGESLRIRGESMVRPHRVVLREVRVPQWRLIGEQDQGFAALTAGFNLERILIASVALGAAHFCLRTATEHARHRKVFQEKPIGGYQALQHPLADVRIRLEAVELLLDKASQAFDGGAPPREMEFLANSAKYLASEVGLQAVDRALQTLGGHGFDEHQGIIQMWEAMRLLKLSPISNELILNRVGEQILALPRH